MIKCFKSSFKFYLTRNVLRALNLSRRAHMHGGSNRERSESAGKRSRSGPKHAASEAGGGNSVPKPQDQAKDKAASGVPKNDSGLKNDSGVKPILILGVGNKLLKDEGIGVHFVEGLMEEKLPPNVDVEDGGARGIDLLTLFRGRRLVIIVDAARMGKKPGTVRIFEPEEVMKKHTKGFSVHGASLADTLKLGEHLGVLPEIVIVGIEPETVEIDIGLTETARNALSEVREIVDRTIRERG
jgi:hydrogenase maturation protease